MYIRCQNHLFPQDYFGSERFISKFIINLFIQYLFLLYLRLLLWAGATPDELDSLLILINA